MEIKKIDLQPNPRPVESNSSQQIFLSVIIGNGDIGGNYVTLNDSFLIKGDFSHAVLLGTIDSLRGKIVQIMTNVLDNSPSDTSVITTTFSNENGIKLFNKVDQDKISAGGGLSYVGNYLIL